MSWAVVGPALPHSRRTAGAPPARWPRAAGGRGSQKCSTCSTSPELEILRTHRIIARREQPENSPCAGRPVGLAPAAQSVCAFALRVAGARLPVQGGCGDGGGYGDGFTAHDLLTAQRSCFFCLVLFCSVEIQSFKLKLNCLSRSLDSVYLLYLHGYHLSARHDRNSCYRPLSPPRHDDVDIDRTRISQADMHRQRVLTVVSRSGIDESRAQQLTRSSAVNTHFCARLVDAALVDDAHVQRALRGAARELVA